MMLIKNVVNIDVIQNSIIILIILFKVLKAFALKNFYKPPTYKSQMQKFFGKRTHVRMK